MTTKTISRRFTAVIAVGAAAALLAGCQTTSSRCRQSGSGMICTFGGLRDAQQMAASSSALRVLAALADMAGIQAQSQAPLTPATFDARLLKIDFTSSNVPVKTNSGMMSLRLLQGSTPIAESQFPWKKSGNAIVPSDPAYMTSWVRSFPMADGYDYSMDVDFEPTTAPNTTVQSNHLYNGASQGITRVTQPTYRGGIGDDRDEK